MSQRVMIKRFFDTVSFSSAGQEMTETIIGQGYKFQRASGYIQQIVLQKINGSATSVDIEIRYEQGNSGIANLAYSYTSGSLDFIDSSIAAPFSLKGHGGNFFDDLTLYIKPNADATFNVRIDIEIDLQN